MDGEKREQGAILIFLDDYLKTVRIFDMDVPTILSDRNDHEDVCVMCEIRLAGPPDVKIVVFDITDTAYVLCLPFPPFRPSFS